MITRFAPRIRHSMGRLVLGLAVYGSTLSGMFQQPAPVLAADELPNTRIQILVKRIYIANDHDIFWGNSFRFHGRFRECQPEEGVCSPQDVANMLAEYDFGFSGHTGDTVYPDRALPLKRHLGDEEVVTSRVATGYDASDIAGLPVYPATSYAFDIYIWPRDIGSRDEPERAVITPIVDGEIKYGINTIKTESLKYPDDDYGFEVQYEIRKMPLPDLSPVAMQVIDLPGSNRKLACATISNLGPLDAPAFEVRFRLNQSGASFGTFSAGGMAAGTSGDACVEGVIGGPGETILEAEVDYRDAVYEQNDRNNLVERRVQVGPATGATGNAKADLSIQAIHLQGREPSGQDDCDPGKNDVTVTIKNSGNQAASAFLVSVAVDGENDAYELPVVGLDGGKSQDVTFDDVKFKKGAHQLIATADVKNAITETSEENARTFSVTCKNE